MALGSCRHQHQGEEQPYASHKPYTRWWWFASEIDTDDVREQLIWLKDHEFGGVEIAWLYPMGLDTTTVKPPFMSEDWSKAVVYAKHIADSLGLGCDFTYGTLWPFSDVNMPDGDQSRNFFDSVEVAERALTWDHPQVGRILNHLDKNAFLRYAERMDEHLAEAYKGSRSGLFVDSWEVETNYLWTPGFEKTFMDEHGYDILPYMQQRTLNDKANADVKYDYMKTLSAYVMREFYQPFAEHATRNNTFSRAQCGGAPTDLLTAFTLVDVPETEAILYEPCFSKIAASAATLADRDAVTAETFTCAYGWTSLRYNNFRGHSPHQGKEQIADLRLICDALFANGTNQIIWHGMPFNHLGDTTNYFYTTCQVSMHPENNLTGQQLADFNRYMTTVSDYMRRGENYTDVAVYMPLEDAWMAGKYPDEVHKQMAWLWGQYEMRFIQTPDFLKGRQPIWVNEHFLQDATFRKGQLLCGKTHFNSLYCDVEYMELTALQCLQSLARQGLPVCMARLPKEPGKVKHAEEYAEAVQALIALDNVTTDSALFGAALPLIEGDNLPDFWVRRDGEDLYAFVANPMTQTISYPLAYEYAFTDKGSERQMTVNHHGRTDRLTLTFRPNESLVLHICPDGVEVVDLNYTAPHLPVR